MDTKMKDPVTAYWPIVEMSLLPPNKKLELREVVKKERTPRSMGGTFAFFPLALASAICLAKPKEFFKAQPQKKTETGKVTVARDGRDEKTVDII